MIQLYAADTNSTGTAQASILLQTGPPILTNGNGNFNLTFPCPSPSTQVYITATGGNPGLAPGTSNNNLSLMTALGNCGDLNASTFISMNEVTTATAAAALAPFARAYSYISSLPTDAGALTNDFKLSATLADFTHGSAPGASRPPGFTVDAAKINGLADAAAACINSPGNATAGDGSPCGQLFQYSTLPNGTAPTNVADALINIARSPTQNVSQIDQLATPSAPFNPTPASVPADWSLLPQSALASPANPVTLTLSQANTDPIPNSHLIPWNDPKVLWSYGVKACGDNFPDNYAGCSQYVSNDAGQASAYLDLQDVTDFAVQIKGFGAVSYRLFVDGVAVNPLGLYDSMYVSPPHDGNIYYLHLAWPVRASHKIRFESNEFVFGFEVDSQAAITPSTTKLGHRVEILGDSYVEPAYGFIGFSQLLGDPTGWEVLNSGNGGTGLITTNPATNRGNYQSRVQADVCQATPDELILYGSINDGGHSAAEEQNAAHSLVTTVRACSPATDIILMGPICAPERDCSSYQELSKGLQAEASADGLTFIDPIAEAWIPVGAYHQDFCSGSFGNNCPADLVHPTQSGHNAIAAQLLKDLHTLRPLL